MDNILNKVYLYDHVRQLSVIADTFCNCKDTGPMNKNPIKAHRGLDNTLIFRALGPDRVPHRFSPDEQVYVRVIDPGNETVVLEKLCRLGPAVGLITVNLDAGDTAVLHTGLYTMVLIRTENFVANSTDYYIEKPVYSDMNDNVSMELEITDQAARSPTKSFTFEEKDWSPDLNMPQFGPIITSFYTERVPGSRVLNHINSVHTFSTYTENFTGFLEIWGSLEESPDPYLSSMRWFKVYPTSSLKDIEYIKYTGTQYWTFSSNCMWLKFRYVPSSQVLDPGKFIKLIVRP